MVVSLSLLVLDIISLSVYIDLYLVNKYQVHLFSPVLPFIGKARLKSFQQSYYASLQRKFFCVSDKVEVSGTTFTVIFSSVYVLSLISNFLEIGSRTTLFYMIGVPYFIYLMFCLHYYRTTRELCFYCKYALVQNLVLLIIMGAFYLEEVPRLYLWSTLVIFFATMVGRGLARKQRAKELKRRV